MLDYWLCIHKSFVQHCHIKSKVLIIISTSLYVAGRGDARLSVCLHQIRKAREVLQDSIKCHHVQLEVPLGVEAGKAFVDVEQYLMGHSDISVTMNTYTHLGLDDARDEMVGLEELEKASKKVEKSTPKSENNILMFRVG